MAEERSRGRRGSGNGERRGGRRRSATPTTEKPDKAEKVAVSEEQPLGPKTPEQVAIAEGSTDTVIDLNSLYKMDNQTLGSAAKDLGITGSTSMRKASVAPSRANLLALYMLWK